jgi:excisionase family DNA binding protein
MESEATTCGENLQTKEQVAKNLQVDVRTVEQLMHDGVLPYFKLGKKNPKAKRDRRVVRFSPADVSKYLEKNCKVK